jgi:hypothetical protein
MPDFDGEIISTSNDRIGDPAPDQIAGEHDGRTSPLRQTAECVGETLSA